MQHRGIQHGIEKRISDMMMLKILLLTMPRSGMPLIADAEFMTLRGQRTGHCTIDVHLGTRQAEACAEQSSTCHRDRKTHAHAMRVLDVTCYPP